MAEEEDDEENTFRIMIASDTHLGYCDTDPVRAQDSFAAFEEVLRLSKERKSDMLLLAGDLFHENKPSRWTMQNSIRLLETHALGDEPVSFEILGDPALNFRSGSANYECPHVSIGLPIFSIHGNHDEPSRDGGPAGSLAALDLLSSTRLVNYFGRQEKVDDIEILPILLRKGETNVAIYGLGNMRDERLSRAWTKEKLRFVRPPEEENVNYFNIFVIHQNRNLGRGGLNCVHDTMIPDWFDLVVWGHEHECQIEPWVCGTGVWVTQPGSSVATSCAAGEEVQKHIGLLKIRNLNFKMEAIPLTMVRPFVLRDFVLADDQSLIEANSKKHNEAEGGPTDSDVSKVLAKQVDSLLQSAPTHKPRYADQTFKLESPDLVLARLRVDHTGFPKVHTQRFGQSFVDKVANPGEILHFTRAANKKKTAASSSKNKKKGGKKNATSATNDDEDFDDLDDDDDPVEDEMNQDQLEILFKGTLKKKEMKLLDEDKMLEALEDFVKKTETSAFQEYVTNALEVNRETWLKTTKLDDDLSSRIDEDKKAREEKKDQKKKKASGAGPADKKKKSSSKNTTSLDDDDDDESSSGDDDSRPASKKTTRTKKAPAKRKKDDSDDDDDDVPVAKKAKKAPPKKPAARAAKRKKTSDSGSGDDSEAPPSKKAAPKKRGRPASDDDDAPPPARQAPARRTRGKKVNYAGADESDDNIDDDDDDDDDEDAPPLAQKTKKKPAPAKKKQQAESIDLVSD